MIRRRSVDVLTLARAELDDVLALWSGLGYYSRARNLHRCARDVVALHRGEFPRTAAELQTLPGIGRSTAAAISSFCFGERVAILDGNVKRVLTRVLGFREDLASAANERALWTQAESLLPTRGVRDAMPRYTQGVMDLRATICLASKPNCMLCPVNDFCVARREGAPETYPVKTRKLKRTSQSLWLLRAQAPPHNCIWLEKRPGAGVWAGLYCLPVFESYEALQHAVPQCRELRDAPAFLHVLTHKDLHLHPVSGHFERVPLRGRDGAWFKADEWPRVGLPAPIRKLLAG